MSRVYKIRIINKKYFVSFVTLFRILTFFLLSCYSFVFPPCSHNSARDVIVLGIQCKCLKYLLERIHS